MTSFVQLYATQIANADASGNVTITINGPRLNRTWLGSLTLLGAPQGTGFTVSVGAQKYGTLYSPGPGGLFELMTGQNLVATASGLTVGTQVTALLAGADYPKDQAPPYFGPVLVTAVSSGGPTNVLPLALYDELSIDWAWSGTTVLPSGATGYIPPKRIPRLAGQVVTIKGVQYWGRTGGDIFKLQYNGVDLGAPTTWTTVTGTWTVDTASAIFPITVANGDYIVPVFTTAAGDGWAVGVIYTTSPST